MSGTGTDTQPSAHPELVEGSLSKDDLHGIAEAMYMNVFRSRKRADMDAAAYQADAARMVQLAQEQPGFVSYKTFVAEDGETVTMSEWETRDHALAWQRNAEHGAVQKRGRGEYYESYTVYSCDQPDVRRFSRES